LTKQKPGRVVLCGRRDAALVCLFAAAVESRIDLVAVEELLTSFSSLFQPPGRPINAASILPGLLHGFGDIEDLIVQIGVDRVLSCAPQPLPPANDSAPKRRYATRPERFSAEPGVLLRWLDRPSER
jgi:hypothetical protein